MKTFLIIIFIFAYLYFAIWAFNHIDAWIGIAILMGGIAYIMYKINNIK